MKTRNITEGAILLGIYMILLLITLFVPLLGTIAVIALVVPFVIYTVRNGWKSGIWFVVGANVLSILLGSLAALTISVPVSTVGLVMGHLFSKNSNRYAILGAATGIYLLNLVLGYIVAIVLFNFDLMEILTESANQSMITAEAFVSSLGQQNTDEAMELMQEYVDNFMYLLPSLLVIIAFIFAFISQLVSGFVLKRLKVEVNSFPPFREVVLPKSLLWYYLIVILLSLIKMEEGSTIYLATLNLSYILMLLMTVQGLSFLFFISHEKKIPKAVPITALILSFLLPPLLYIIRMVGIIDIGFNLRKRWKSKK